MKIIQEYEESDIDLKGNVLHGVISVGILISSLVMAPPKSIVPVIEDADKNIRSGVATFLNMLSKSGYSITKVEDIPEAFKNI